MKSQNNHFLKSVHSHSTSSLLSLFLACWLAFPGLGHAQYTILHNFGSVTGDTTSPTNTGMVKASNGSLYGVTASGGSAGHGGIFKVTPSSGTVTTIASFSSAEDPVGSLIQNANDGYLYGVTYQGGSAGSGSIYSIATDGSSLADIASFGAYPNADSPHAGLLQGNDGNFYGTLYSFGGPPGYGAVYRYNRGIGAVNVLHEFTGSPDGYGPGSVLVQDTSGNFYGTTTAGGSVGNGINTGTVFKMAISGGAIKILRSFGDGSQPNDGSVIDIKDGLILDSVGNLYGLTRGGGSAGVGTVFKITSPGSASPNYSKLHDFGAVTGDGFSPQAGLMLGSDGNFYGTTAYGGSNGAGTVFMMTPSGTVTILHNFPDPSISNDGSQPYASLVESGGFLYGTTQTGGSVGYGTVFKLALSLPATDTPTMPFWALVGLALLLILIAARSLPIHPA